MSQLEFVAAVITATAWPVTVIVLAVLFRHPLGRVIATVSRFKMKDVELEFKRELQAIAAAVPDAPLPDDATPQAEAAIPAVPQEVKAVSEVSPRAAIPLAWAELESELRQAVFRTAKGAVDVPLHGFHKRIYALRAKGMLDADTAESIDRLRELRNRVVHGDLSVSALSESDAWRYAELAQRVAARLREIR